MAEITRTNLTGKKITKGGFAALSAERRKEIAIMGGKAVQVQGKGHQFTPEEASAAGKKGGATTMAKPGFKSKLGRLGGLASAKKKRELKGLHETPVNRGG